MKKTLLLLGALATVASAQTAVNYSFTGNGTGGTLSDTAGGAFATITFTTSVGGGATAPYQAAASDVTGVTTGTFQWRPVIDNDNGDFATIGYSISITDSNYSLSSAQWGSGNASGILGGNATNAGSNTGSIPTFNSGIINFTESTGADITFTGNQGATYTITNNGSNLVTLTGVSSGTGVTYNGQDFGHYFATDVITGLASDFTLTNASTANNNVQAESLALQLSFTQVPEPTSAALLGLGGLALLGRRKRA